MGLRIAEKASLSDVGRARQTNEDSYLERSPLFVVADGMGGARAGEVASAIAVDTAKAADVGASPEQDLAEVAKAANREIYRRAQEDAEQAGMGTTFTGALVTGNEVVIGHVGDSRMYRLRGGELERLTQDHSLVEEFVRQGKLTPAEAEVHPQRSIITRALGPEPEVEVDTFTYHGRDGDIYLICSDGLTGMVSEESLAAIITSSDSLEDAARRLIEEANANGGRDNITALLFRLAGDDDGDEDSDTLGGQETSVVSAANVREAVREADADAAGESRASVATSARDDTRLRNRTFEGGVPATSPIAARRAPPVPRRKRVFAAAGILLVLLAAVAVVWVVDRQFWFVGTDDSGQVTLYQGLPYELPLGIDLYSEKQVTGVPAAAIADRRQRQYVLDHHPRAKNDSVDLARQIEQNFNRR